MADAADSKSVEGNLVRVQVSPRARNKGKTMTTISQALRQAARLKNQISEWQNRAQNSLIFVEGTSPPFDFIEMSNNAEQCAAKLSALKAKIAIANATTRLVYKDKTLALVEAIAVLQELKGRISWLKQLPVKSAITTCSTTRVWSDELDKTVEKSIQTTCCLPEYQRSLVVDELQDQFDELNSLIEEKNQVTHI